MTCLKCGEQLPAKFKIPLCTPHLIQFPRLEEAAKWCESKGVKVEVPNWRAK